MLLLRRPRRTAVARARAASSGAAQWRPPRRLPPKQGLYDPALERDSCGVGMVAHLKGQASHEIVRDANTMLVRMAHRGGCGCEPSSGDGAGMLTGMPHAFLTEAVGADLGVALPAAGAFGAGNVFFPRDPAVVAECKAVVERHVSRLGLSLIGWRPVPVDNSALGPTSLESEPHTEMLLVGGPSGGAPLPEGALDRELYRLRLAASNEIHATGGDAAADFYVCSLNTSTLVYKGQLTPEQARAAPPLPPRYPNPSPPPTVWGYFVDLQSAQYTSHLALVHSRFSTNTFPSWARAQPFRALCHNGEINTLRGNKNMMRSREAPLQSAPLRRCPRALLQSAYFGEAMSELGPICSDDLSDSGNFDAVAELLLRAGEIISPHTSPYLPELLLRAGEIQPRSRSGLPTPPRGLPSSARVCCRPLPAHECSAGDRPLHEAVMMMVPEAWQGKPGSPARKAFYAYNANLMEPWDGPAMMSFTDGRYVGACLDRNGLRPSRYYVTTDDRVLLSSEVGVLDHLDEAVVKTKARLEPGRMFLIDFAQQRIVPDEELKETMAAARPYEAWMASQPLLLDEWVAEAAVPPAPHPARGTLNSTLSMHGFTKESSDLLVAAMARGKEALGSMGVDTPLAALSSQPRMPSHYFKQLFAQVTNPPIDPIREEIVMSLQTPVGPEANLLEATEAHARRLVLPHPGGVQLHGDNYQ
ncbi:ferredoxin-dependent glutamate synthase [Emiliania huxleyi CCMP1516]|uniref:glutamate synthase (ferredoxin) n=2 Tax=Emiliania huxleyi TaxID=2903 RepID=A0A0D3KHE5_EMIH1|nr:ferredoxin-dependent glutamate synthase [Emiliania huxleyi CCMP1516]EOD35180.1 ferredoxin-dependent glutamate synthase [Emiliania huxleyi CCMP1516]|eukprot:XP_005787609.1 ferredoxin-dependent glutamate synthase [Emiliania huxleyi CCMP1516]